MHPHEVEDPAPNSNSTQSGPPHEGCEPPTCDVSRTPVASRPNLANRSNPSLKWPTLAVQFNDFSADNGQPMSERAYIIFKENKRIKIKRAKFVSILTFRVLHYLETNSHPGVANHQKIFRLHASRLAVVR